jgi:hypothetical protein
VQIGNTGLDVYRHAINHSFTTFRSDPSAQYSLAQYIRIVLLDCCSNLVIVAHICSNLLPSPNEEVLFLLRYNAV